MWNSVSEDMFRKTLTILSLLGLLLNVGLWGASCFNFVYWGQGSPEPFLEFSFGVILWDRSPTVQHVPSIFAVNGATADFSESRWAWQVGDSCGFYGFRGWGLSLYPVYVSSRGGVLPLWIPTGVFAALFYFSHTFPLRYRRKREKLGLCVKCGYDLRGSKERCPECGSRFAK